jgi:hypothetical protein
MTDDLQASGHWPRTLRSASESVLLIALILSPAPSWCETPTCTPTSWITVAANPTPRYGNAGVAELTGVYFYSIGGSNITGMLNNHDRYDLANNTWVPRAPIPIAVQDARAVYVPGPGGAASRIFVLGGLDSATNAVFDTVQVYDIDALGWVPVPFAPIPAPRFGSYVGRFGNKIYVAGGFPVNDVNTATATTFEYDVNSNAWTTRAPMPNVNALGAYATIGQFLYTFGGWRGNPCCDGDSYRYDMANDVWTTIATLPTAVEGAAAGVIDGQIWIAGGGIPFGPRSVRASSGTDRVDALGVTQVYHPVSNTYTTGPILNQARARSAGDTIPAPGGVTQAFVTGGYTGAVVTGSSERSSCPVPANLIELEIE